MARAVGSREAPVDVVGWSLGGLVAQELCCVAPSEVRRAVLASTSPGGDDLAELISRDFFDVFDGWADDDTREGEAARRRAAARPRPPSCRRRPSRRRRRRSPARSTRPGRRRRERSTRAPPAAPRTARRSRAPARRGRRGTSRRRPPAPLASRPRAPRPARPRLCGNQPVRRVHPIILHYVISRR